MPRSGTAFIGVEMISYLGSLWIESAVDKRQGAKSRDMSTLYLVVTPIGNMDDITFRALRVLQDVDALACEDTRFTRRIFERYDLTSPGTIFSCHEHNEARAASRIVELLDGGKSVGLCSNGGYPAMSDPGYRVVNAAIEHGHKVEVVPGACAVPTALVASGLATSSYTFKGFPPRKSGPRRRFLEAEKVLPHTLVIFESPHRVGKLLKDALDVLGDRCGAVCVELTKRFEKIHRGYLADLVGEFDGKDVKGEVTVVIAGNNPKFTRESQNANGAHDPERK